MIMQDVVKVHISGAGEGKLWCPCTGQFNSWTPCGSNFSQYMESNPSYCTWVQIFFLSVMTEVFSLIQQNLLYQWNFQPPKIRAANLCIKHERKSVCETKVCSLNENIAALRNENQQDLSACWAS